MIKTKILNKIDSLISQVSALYEASIEYPMQFNRYSETKGVYISCLAFVRDIVGKDSHYYISLVEVEERITDNLGFILENLRNLRSYVDEGWATGIRNLISAEIFDNFLEMAEYLLDEGYKDPAAVITGSVLENHLRDLCSNYEIPTTKEDSSGKLRAVKASSMHVELTKAGAYNLLEQKSVTALLDLRNKAAHGKYSEYDKSQVENMVKSIRDFILRNPV